MGYLRLIAIVVVLHLFLALCSALKFHLPRNRFYGILTAYSVLTGADREFGFFSPNVETETRVTFDTVDSSGRKSVHRFEEGSSRESELRINDIMARFLRVFDGNHKELEDALTASWAGKIFAQYPGTKEVTVNIQFHHLPSLSEYRAGKRNSDWHTGYETKYELQN